MNQSIIWIPLLISWCWFCNNMPSENISHFTSLLNVQLQQTYTTDWLTFPFELFVFLFVLPDCRPVDGCRGRDHTGGLQLFRRPNRILSSAVRDISSVANLSGTSWGGGEKQRGLFSYTTGSKVGNQHIKKSSAVTYPGEKERRHRLQCLRSLTWPSAAHLEARKWPPRIHGHLYLSTSIKSKHEVKKQKQKANSLVHAICICFSIYSHHYLGFLLTYNYLLNLYLKKGVIVQWLRIKLCSYEMYTACHSEVCVVCLMQNTNIIH